MGCLPLLRDARRPAAALADTVLLGELALDGGLRPITGVLPMVLAAAGRGVRTVVVPEPQAAEAALVPGLTVLGVRSLRQVADRKSTRLNSSHRT